MATDLVPSMYRLGSGAILLILLHGLVTCLYRIFSHPLRSVPGPWLNKISPAPGALMLLLRRQHSYYYGLHSRYGPLVRVGPNEIVSNDPSSWEEIYGFKNGPGLERAPTFLGIVAPAQGIVRIGMAKGKQHTRLRRGLAPFFTKVAVLKQREVVHLHVEKLLSLVLNRCENRGSMNMARWYAYFTFNIMTHLCFGEPCESLDEDSKKDWPDAVFNLMIPTTWDQSIRLLAGPDSLLSKLLQKLVPARVRECKRVHINKTREKVTQCLSQELETSQEGLARQISHSASHVETILDVAFLLVAGAETTSILLTGLTYCICTNSDAYTKLANEIRTAFTCVEDIELEATLTLPYLDAAIRESFRIFPPASVNNQRVSPPGGIFVQGVHLPEGTTAGISPWAISRSAKNFHLPEEYHPERWMQDADNCFRGDRLSASKPFGHGSKACLGEALAMAEAKLLISKMLWQFDVRLEEGQNTLWSLKSDSGTMKTAQTLRVPDLWVQFANRAH